MFFTLFIVFISSTFAKEKDIQAVGYVNPQKFLGLWYEIARTYNSYEENCYAPTVEYISLENNKLKVFNRCFVGSFEGKLKVYEGIVEPIKNNSLASLEKTYFYIFSKEYKIIYLDDYQTAVMSDESFENLWIMHRKPFMKKHSLNRVLSFLDEYLDTQKLIFPKQHKKGIYK